MELIRRSLSIDLPKGQSAFLWGPRKTGKTTLLRTQFPESLVYDLLDTKLFLQLSRDPSLLRQQLLAAPPEKLEHPIIIDEVQKVPALLDEVHWLIENRRLRFILSGSSARKLKRGKANLLGGRAWRFQLFPLVFDELDTPDLLRILNRGLVPSHYLTSHYRRSQRGYVVDYLKEEVFDEGLTRNISAFSRFFESMGYSHGELTNFANIARDCGIDAKTVKENYQILVDTLVGTWVAPFKRRQDRNVIVKASKFYLFDVGVAGTLTNRRLEAERGEEFGKALEHYVLMELRAHSSYKEMDYPIHYWRTKSGLEVDFVLGAGEVALEVKGKSRVDPRDLRSLSRFVEEYSPQTAIVVCNEARARIRDGIRIMPWAEFLRELWSGGIVG
jgi:predicted AAA+ superfamily ATPase